MIIRIDERRCHSIELFWVAFFILSIFLGKEKRKENETVHMYP